MNTRKTCGSPSPKGRHSTWRYVSERTVVCCRRANSSSQRKKIGEPLRWFHKSEGLAWPIVEAASEPCEILFAMHGEVRSFRHVLTKQPVRILVRPSLPRAVRITEVVRRHRPYLGPRRSPGLAGRGHPQVEADATAFPSDSRVRSELCRSASQYRRHTARCLRSVGIPRTEPVGRHLRQE
jgi:hypothetical protein